MYRYLLIVLISVADREFVACLNLLKTGGGYPSDRLDQLWKETLLYQFHDILPGSSIKRVYDECEKRCEWSSGPFASCSCFLAQRRWPLHR